MANHTEFKRRLHPFDCSLLSLIDPNLNCGLHEENRNAVLIKGQELVNKLFPTVPQESDVKKKVLNMCRGLRANMGPLDELEMCFNHRSCQEPPVPQRL